MENISSQSALQDSNMQNFYFIFFNLLDLLFRVCFFPKEREEMGIIITMKTTTITTISSIAVIIALF